MTTVYENLNNMEELELRAGSDKVLTFSCYQSDGVNPLNITGGSLSWKLCPYGQFGINVLTIAGIIETASTFSVTIAPSDTSSLSGKYIQQVEITDYYGNTFTPGQGIVLIFPKISD